MLWLLLSMTRKIMFSLSSVQGASHRRRVKDHFSRPRPRILEDIMCDFISWKEHEGSVYFLTSLDFDTKQGRRLIKEFCDGDSCHKDLRGHGFINRFYPELEGKGVERECTDFSNPKNFPDEIVRQIKNSNMRYGIGEGLLSYPAYAKYEKIRDPAYAEYQKIRGAAYAEYQKINYEAFWNLFDDPKNRAKAWK